MDIRRYINFKKKEKLDESTACKFVLLFQGRTGSTYITECMNAHPHVIMEPEVWGGWGFQIPKTEIAAHITRQTEWLHDFFEKKYDATVRAVGFKTKLDDVLDKKRFIQYLRENVFKIIHMTRQNHVKLVISEINAQRLFDKQKRWNIDNKSQRPGPFYLDIDRFDDQLKWREKIEDWLDSYISLINVPTLKLYYEDLLANEKDFFKKITSFIGVTYVETSGVTKKNTPDNLNHIIKNIDALFIRYKYTKYEPMILL